MYHWALILMFLLQIWVSYEAPKHIHDINFKAKKKQKQHKKVLFCKVKAHKKL